MKQLAIILIALCISTTTVYAQGRFPLPLSVEPTSLLFNYTGGTQTVTVKTNSSSLKWTTTKPAVNWAQLRQNGNTITITTTKNDSDTKRTTSFTVNLGKQSKKVSITQEAQPPQPTQPRGRSLELSKDTLEFGCEGGWNEIIVSARDSWSIGKQPADWVETEIKPRGIYVTVSKNINSKPRTDYFTVVCGNQTRRVKITQHSAKQPPVPIPVTPGNRAFTVGDVSFKMIWVQGGTFTMGCTSEQGSDCNSDERPMHNITVSSYSIGATEVTQALWRAVMGNNPSEFKDDNRPVENVSWYEAVEFCNKLSQALNLTPYYTINKSVQDPDNNSRYDRKKFIVTINIGANGFRLPTEAEWEYAARGGNKTQRYKFAGNDDIKYVAWYRVNSYDKGSENWAYGTHRVKTKRPNELGLYDMSGNVCEWCWDWSHSYNDNQTTNPQGPLSGSERISRGGSWKSGNWHCRVSARNSTTPDYRDSGFGFRIVLP